MPWNEPRFPLLLTFVIWIVEKIKREKPKEPNLDLKMFLESKGFVFPKEET